MFRRERGQMSFGKKSWISEDIYSHRLLGWGSNQCFQLGEDVPPFSPQQRAHLLSNTLPPAIRGSNGANATGVVSDDLDSTALVNEGSALHIEGLEDRFVVAGGDTSAVLHCGSVRIFGSLLPCIEKCIRLNNSGVISTDVSGEIAGQLANRSIVIDGVEGVAIGRDHLLLLHRRRCRPVSTEGGSLVQEFEDAIIAVGSDSHEQCTGGHAAAEALCAKFIHQKDLVLVPNPATDGASFMIATSLEPSLSKSVLRGSSRVLKLAVGLLHSAAISSEGGLVTWGDNSHGQCLSQSSALVVPDAAATAATATDAEPSVAKAHGYSVWTPPNGAKLVDLACGATFTLCLDDLGVVYQLGSLGVSHGEAGSGFSGPVIVPNLPKDVRWQRVSCNIQ